MSLLDQFKDYILKNQLFHLKDKLLIAVSGGVDSVVLCNLCKQLGYEFKMAHCNFQLRGVESERDEDFVKKLGEQLGVQVFVKKFDTKSIAANQKLSIQEAARKLRYEWFDELLRNLKTQQYRFLLTAHHRDDAIETMLMNFFKGTGIAGLRGILPKNNLVVRPLLFAAKEEILAYAKENKLDWVEDSSNEETHYTRNKFRVEIIPNLKKIYATVEENLIDNLSRFSDLEILYQQSIERHKARLLEKRKQDSYIAVLKLKQTEPLLTVIYELIKDFGFDARQVIEVKKLLASESGKYIQSATHRIIRDRKWLIITPLNHQNTETIIIEKETKKVTFMDGILLMEVLENNNKIKLPSSPLEAFVDACEINYPLVLRKPRPADYFYPLGMKKKKKLARFFIDQKFSLTEKEKIWVLESDKKNCWILGHRIDDRFKITESTKQILKLTLKLT